MTFILTILEIITTKFLKYTTVFAETIGPAQLHHETWNLIVVVEKENINERFIKLREIYTTTLMMFTNCTGKFELNFIIKVAWSFLKKITDCSET